LSPQNHEIQSINTKASLEKKGREAKYSEVSLEQNPGQNLKRNLTENSEQPPNPEGNSTCKPHGCNSISIKLSNQVCPISIIFMPFI
jgi:hypothetical protein